MKIIIIADNLEHGGVASAVKGFFYALKRNYPQDQIDFVVYKTPTVKTQEDFLQFNSHIFVTQSVSMAGPLKYARNIQEILIKNGPYDAIHMHTGPFIWLAAKTAKKVGIKSRIGHAHGSGIVKKKLLPYLVKLCVTYIGRRYNRKYCTTLFACSDKSGKFNFGKSYRFLPNIVNIEKICVENPVDLYSEFNLSNECIVIGYLGVFGTDKNTAFLVDIMKLFASKKDIYCLMAGDGDQFTSVKERVEKEGLQDKVKLLGYRNDGNRLLKFFDVLVAPSFTEGMSLTLLEAQLTGTPCVVSKQIPQTNDLQMDLYYPVGDFIPQNWKNKILEVLSCRQNTTLEWRLGKLKDIGYDNDTVARVLHEAFQND